MSGRLIFLSIELSYFLFLKVGLLTELTALQFRAEPGTLLPKGLLPI
jgi:hypothetical protein